MIHQYKLGGYNIVLDVFSAACTPWTRWPMTPLP